MASSHFLNSSWASFRYSSSVFGVLSSSSRSASFFLSASSFKKESFSCLASSLNSSFNTKPASFAFWLLSACLLADQVFEPLSRLLDLHLGCHTRQYIIQAHLKQRPLGSFRRLPLPLLAFCPCPH